MSKNWIWNIYKQGTRLWQTCLEISLPKLSNILSCIFIGLIRSLLVMVLATRTYFIYYFLAIILFLMQNWKTINLHTYFFCIFNWTMCFPLFTDLVIMEIIVSHLYPECLKTRLYLLLVGIHSVHVCCILKEVLFFYHARLWKASYVGQLLWLHFSKKCEIASDISAGSFFSSVVTP